MKFLSDRELINRISEVVVVDNQDWKDYISNNSDWAENIQLSMSELARYTLIALKNKETNKLNKLFDTLEIIFVNTDEVSKEKIATGFIEPLQNNMLGDHIPLNSFEKYMGIITKEQWEGVINYWNQSV